MSMSSFKVPATSVPPMYEIASIDVTADQLRGLCRNEHLKKIIEPLADQWTIGDKEREKNIRIGTVDVFIDDEGNLHLDFQTRFSVTRA